MSQVVSDIENKDTHCNFFNWLQNSDYFTYIYSRTVLLFWQTEICKIKMELFLETVK